jgi:hypothetical protein
MLVSRKPVSRHARAAAVAAPFLIAVIVSSCSPGPLVSQGARGAARCSDAAGDVLGASSPVGGSVDLKDALVKADGRTISARFDVAGQVRRSLPSGTSQSWSARLFSPSGGYLGELRIVLDPKRRVSGSLIRATLPPVKEAVGVSGARVSIAGRLADIPGLLAGFRWMTESDRTSASGASEDFCPAQDEGSTIITTMAFPAPGKPAEPQSPFTKTQR